MIINLGLFSEYAQKRGRGGSAGFLRKRKKKKIGAERGVREKGGGVERGVSRGFGY